MLCRLGGVKFTTQPSAEVQEITTYGRLRAALRRGRRQVRMILDLAQCEGRTHGSKPLVGFTVRGTLLATHLLIMTYPLLSVYNYAMVICVTAAMTVTWYVCGRAWCGCKCFLKVRKVLKTNFSLCDTSSHVLILLINPVHSLRLHQQRQGHRDNSPDARRHPSRAATLHRPLPPQWGGNFYHVSAAGVRRKH